MIYHDFPGPRQVVLEALRSDLSSLELVRSSLHLDRSRVSNHDRGFAPNDDDKLDHPHV